MTYTIDGHDYTVTVDGDAMTAEHNGQIIAVAFIDAGHEHWTVCADDEVIARVRVEEMTPEGFARLATLQ